MSERDPTNPFAPLDNPGWLDDTIRRAKETPEAQIIRLTAEVERRTQKGLDYLAEVERLTAEVEDAHRREACAADLAREWEHHCKAAEADVARLTTRVKELEDALENIRARRYENRETVNPENAFKAFGRLNAEVCAIYAECDAVLSASQPAPSPWPETIETYYARQIEWSRETFGPGKRTGGIIDHITKELREVAAEPEDLSEWVDLIILAMDGFWRHGGRAEDLMPRLLAKQKKNMARKWPDWRTMSADKAIEHDRSADLPPPPQKEGE
jgi:hypothetical protein